MLNTMRENLRHLKWVLWIVAISMVLSMGYYFARRDPGGPGAGWAARVNGAEVGEREFLRAARNFDLYYRQLFGDNYADLRSQLRIGSIAMQALIEERLVLQDAGRLGLKSSKAQVAEAIRNDPRFHDENGQFVDIKLYKDAVTRAEGSVAAFEEAVSRQLLLEQWTRLVTQSVTVDDADVEQAHRQRTVKTTLDYVMVPSADQIIEPAPGDAAVQSWYESHQDDYQRGAGRKLRYFVISREAQREKVNVTEEELVASYEANQSSYSHPEQRAARHILLNVPADADAETVQRLGQDAETILERVKGGEDFAALARAMSHDPTSAQVGGDLGYFARGAMVPDFEAAAFATPVGEFAPVVKTDFGFHIIQVTDSREAGVRPIDDVREELLQSLTAQRSQELVTSEAERLHGELTGGADIATVAQREGLELTERFVTADERLGDIGAAPEFITTVFEVEAGSVAPPLRVAAGMALTRVDEEVEAQLAPLAEVRGEVRSDLLNDLSRQLAYERAQNALEGGRDMAAAAQRLDLEIASSGELSPGQALPGTGGSTPEFQQTLFGDAISVGDRGVLEVPGGALVYEVTAKEEFDYLAYEMAKPDLRDELLTSRRNIMRQAVADKLRPQAEIQINDALVARIDGAG